MRRRIVIAGIAAAAVLAPGSALAWWSASVVPATTTATAGAHVLAPATAAASAASATSISVTAKAPTTGGILPTAFRVQRGGTTLPGCEHLAFTATCTETGLQPGTSYTYQVYGLVGSAWVSTSSVQTGAKTSAPSVTVAQVSRSQGGSDYTFTGTSAGGGTITLTVYRSYYWWGCTLTDQVGTLTVTGDTWSVSASGLDLLPNRIYYVKATMADAAASSVSSFTAPGPGRTANATSVC